MSLLECKSVSCSYGDKHVLANLDLTIEEGESVALLGPNGTGKSTLLKACTKTLAYQGSIKLQGKELTDLSYAEVAQRVGFVPQEEPAPFPFKVRDVVTLGRLSRSKGLFDSPKDKDAATKAMEFADCLDLADRPITELSGGERQRVLIARAMAQEAPLMLLDEPTSHLDIAHQVGLATIIRRLTLSGVGVLTAIHDLNLAARLATRAVLVSNGQIVKDGPVRAVLESELLDEVYRAKFERVELEDGTLTVFAYLPSPL